MAVITSRVICRRRMRGLPGCWRIVLLRDVGAGEVVGAEPDSVASSVPTDTTLPNPDPR